MPKINHSIILVRKHINSLSIREILLITVTVLVFIFVLFYENGVVPGQIKLQELQQQESALNIENRAYQQELENLEYKYQSRAVELEKRLNELNRRLAEYQVSGTEFTSVPNLLSEMLAESNGLELVSLETGENQLPNESLPLRKYQYHLHFVGKFPDVLRYLYQLKAKAPMVFWEKFEYEVTQFPIADIHLTLYAYQLNEGNHHEGAQ